MVDEFHFQSAAFSAEEINSLMADMTDHFEMYRDIPFDLIILFLTHQFIGHTEYIVSQIQEQLTSNVIIGCTVENIVSSSSDVEGKPGISMLLAQMPGVDLAAFHLDPPAWHKLLNSQRKFKDSVGISKDARIGLLFSDALTTPLDHLLDAFNTWYPGLKLVGGIASGVVQSGSVGLILNDTVYNSGTVGLTISGAIQTDTIFTHGCRPIGVPMEVTLSHDNLILSLNGNRPQDIIEQLITNMDLEDQEALKNGLYIGRPFDRQKSNLKRGDYLISGVYGYEHSSGAIVVGDKFETGETVHFHLHDPSTSQEDFEMSLVPQVFRDPPSAVLLFTCNGRGKGFYGHENVDLSIISQNLNEPQVAGFFSSGEFGSVRGRNYLLSNAACLLLLRPDLHPIEDLEDNG